MRRLLVSAAAAGLVLSMFAAPVSAGTSKYVWDDATPAYAGPAAMLVNNAGAIVWWHVPNTSTWYKDVYRFHDFEGATFWGPVSTLNSPVNNLMLANFSSDPEMWYTREVVDVVPNLGMPTRIYTLRDYRTMTGAEQARFWGATETITGGFIIADPYAPAINVKATGVGGTTAYIGYIETGTGTWHSLGTVDALNGVIDDTLTLQPNTTYDGYFAINNGTGLTQFIAGPLTFTTD